MMMMMINLYVEIQGLRLDERSVRQILQRRLVHHTQRKFHSFTYSSTVVALLPSQRFLSTQRSVKKRYIAFE